MNPERFPFTMERVTEPSGSDTEKLEALLLNAVPGVGPKKFRKLYDSFGSLKKVFSASLEELEAVDGISQAVAERISQADLSQAEKDLKLAESSGIEVLTFGHPHYPAALAALDDAPPVLYCRGVAEALNGPSVALVGSRTPTPYGEKTAARLADELAGLGIAVTSGLARGIDTFAHRAAVDAGGRTFAALGSGLLNVYPPENAELAKSILVKGVLVSELPLKAEPEPGYFPRRNRIIAALSSVTVVVEAGEDSGALITARYAAAQGKPVCAVPGPAASPMSRGPHLLIREGARLVESAEDIIKAAPGLNPLSLRTRTKKMAEQPADGPEGELFGLIGEEPVHIDFLTSRSALPRGEFSRALLSLEMKGAVKVLPGNRYVRT